MVLGKFEHILPEIIFEAVESLGAQGSDRCTGRFLALNAMENRVYEVELEGGIKRVIKFYRPGRWDLPTIQSEHDFLFELEKNEIPVVCPIRDANGETVHQTQGVFFALFDKKAGRLEPELNPSQVEMLGRFLGRLHNVGADFKPTTRRRLDIETYGRAPLETLLSKQFIPSNIQARFKLLVEEICQLAEPLLKNYPYILVHGDCHCGNVLWRENQPYFIDFDDMLYAPAVQDFWMLTGADDEYGIEKRERLITAYEQMREFDDSSLRLIEPLRTLRMIHFNAWIAERWDDGAFKMAWPSFGSERYFQEQIEGLSVQLDKLRAL